MKSHTRPTVLRLAFATLGLATLLVLTVPSAHAATEYTITLTELSSTNLTATYDGPGALFSVPLNTGTDAWTASFFVTQNSTFSLNPTFVFDWTEPENANEVNEVSHGVVFGDDNHLYVTSDGLMEYGSDLTTMHPDNEPVLVGTDFGNPVFLQFHDLAQTNEAGTGVPEGGSSLLLLGVSAASLAGLNRFRRLQMA